MVKIVQLYRSDSDDKLIENLENGLTCPTAE